MQRTWLRAVLLGVLVGAAYSPALRGTYLWDDNAHVPDQTELYTLRGLRNIWTSPGYVQQYYPLTFTTVWLSHHLWRGSPVGYHGLTLLFHIANAVLIALLLRQLGIPAPWLAAFFFALHPVNVESVAWISEIKNTQSTFFLLLGLMSYLRFRTTRSNRWGYALAFFFYACALLTKTAACVLPAVILLVLWFRDGRFPWRDVAALTPFWILGLGLGLYTSTLERTLIGAEGWEWAISPVQRLWIAARAFWFYLEKLLWPAHLAFIYPRWNPDRMRVPGILALAGMAIGFATLWRMRKKIGMGAFIAFLIFLAGLFPALGFFNMYPARYSFVADHFQYLAAIPLFAGAAALIRAVCIRWAPDRPVIFTSTAAILCLALTILSWRRAYAFQDPDALWRDTLAKNPACAMAHCNLAWALLARRQFSEAAWEENQALQQNPRDINILLTAGLMRLDIDKNPNDAILFFKAGLREAEALPDNHAAQGKRMYLHAYLGRAWKAAGNTVEAKREYTEALNEMGALMKRPMFDLPLERLRAENVQMEEERAGLSLSESARNRRSAK